MINSNSNKEEFLSAREAMDKAYADFINCPTHQSRMTLNFALTRYDNAFSKVDHWSGEANVKQ